MIDLARDIAHENEFATWTSTKSINSIIQMSG